MRKGYLYILECSNGTYFTGSTINLEKSMLAHFSGNGANHTKKYPPRNLLYLEDFWEINHAFRREKQVQNWSHNKKSGLIAANVEQLKVLAKKHNLTQYTVRTMTEH
ncbi:MAG: GIY-YIG nuclease family protein [Crocinitomix sp.]|nr:GIY-YIG nuclease family protein [Crocinitomix sp.]